MVVKLLKTLMTMVVCLIALNAQALKIDIYFDGINPNQLVLERGKRYSIIYKISYNNKSDAEIISNLNAPKKVSGCKIIDFKLYNQSTQTAYLFGKTTQTYVVNYLLVVEADKKGKHALGPIKLGNVSSNKLEYKIVSSTDKKKDNNKIDLGLGCEEVFLKVDVNSNQIYEKVPFEYELKLFTIYNDVSNIGFEKMPQFKNCLIEDNISNNRQYSIENVNGRKYVVYTVEKIKVTPQKSGKLKIAKGKYKLNLTVPVYYEDSILGGLSNTFTQTYLLDIPEIIIDVKSLGKSIPGDFSGIIGNCQITPKISNIYPTLNETIILSYIIAGDADGLEQELDRKILAASSENLNIIVKNSAESLPVGFKKCEYYITPKSEGVHIIPELNMKIFNPVTNMFESIVTKGYKIVVGGHKN